MKTYKEVKEDLEARRQQLASNQKDKVERLQALMKDKGEKMVANHKEKEDKKKEQEELKSEIVDTVLKKLLGDK